MTAERRALVALCPGTATVIRSALGRRAGTAPLGHTLPGRRQGGRGSGPYTAYHIPRLLADATLTESVTAAAYNQPFATSVRLTETSLKLSCTPEVHKLGLIDILHRGCIPKWCVPHVRVGPSVAPGHMLALWLLRYTL